VLCCVVFIVLYCDTVLGYSEKIVPIPSQCANVSPFVTLRCIAPLCPFPYTHTPVQVREVRKHIHQYIKEGGVRVAAPAEKSKLAMGLDIFTGKALPSDFNKKQDPSPTAAATAVPVAAPVASPSGASKLFGTAPAAAPAASEGGLRASGGNPFAGGGDPFNEEDEEREEEFAPAAPATAPVTAAAAAVPPPPPPASAPAAPAAPAAAVVVVDRVEALFDHEAEEEDELNFSTGDIVEVIDKADGGWWRGRCHGKEGLFPANYVKPC
jgi:hypothetical protein